MENYLNLRQEIENLRAEIKTLQSTLPSEEFDQGVIMYWQGVLPTAPTRPKEGTFYRDSTDKKYYIFLNGEWSDIIKDGEDGLDGQDGSDGQNGRDGTGVSWRGESPVPPDNPSINDMYRDTSDNTVYIYTNSGWEPMVSSGFDGINGAEGVAGSEGVSIVFIGEFATPPLTPQNGWAYRNTTDGKSYVRQDNTWYVMSIDGTDGLDGINGVDGNEGRSLSFRGEFSSPPPNPELNWAYRDTDNKAVYFYNGTGWELLINDGTDGLDGTSSYTWIKYSNSEDGTVGFSNSSAGREYIGISYDNLEREESENPADYTWSKFIGSDGIPGKDGDPNYTWIKYADNDTGTRGFGDDPNNKRYIGIAYNNIEQEESEDPEDYVWSLIQGQDGEDGVDGGFISFIYRVATSKPSIPTGGTFDGSNEVFPSGWTDDPTHTENDTEWMSKRRYSNNGVSWVAGPWSDPVKFFEKGDPGDDGLPGNSVFITYHRNSISSVPARPTGSGNTNGWSSDPSNDSNWISQKVSQSISTGSWGDPILIKGETGNVGAPGAGIAFRGVFDVSKSYNNNSAVRDVVQYPNTDGSYYIYKGPDKQSFTWSTSRWEEFAEEFESIATNTLLAENANIGNLQIKNSNIVSDKIEIQSIIDFQANDGSYNDFEEPTIKIDGTNGLFTLSKQEGDSFSLGNFTGNRISLERDAPLGSKGNRFALISFDLDGRSRISTEGDEDSGGFNDAGFMRGLESRFNTSLEISPRVKNSGYGSNNQTVGLYCEQPDITSSNGQPTYGAYIKGLKTSGTYLSVERVNSSTYFCEKEVDLVTIDRSSVTNVYLPSSFNSGRVYGRKITIKVLDQNVNIQSGSNTVDIKVGNTNTQTLVMSKTSNGTGSYTFVWDGLDWLVI